MGVLELAKDASKKTASRYLKFFRSDTWPQSRKKVSMLARMTPCCELSRRLRLISTDARRSKDRDSRRSSPLLRFDGLDERLIMTGMATKSIMIPIQNGSHRFVVIVRA